MVAVFVIDGATFDHSTKSTEHSTKAGWLRLNVTGKMLYATISKYMHEPC